MKRTSIEWTDFSSNPLQYRDQKGNVVWGCVKKSSGCANCYSEALAHRYERGGPFTKAAMEGLTPFLDEKELKHILTAKTVGGKPVSGSRCFLGDMTDVFGEWVPDELLDTLFAVMAVRSDVTFQILTKRPDRMRAYLEMVAGEKDMNRWAIAACQPEVCNSPCACNIVEDRDWPLSNVWLGTSVENQQAADERIEHLLATPAAVRFLSCEPLLGPVDLDHWLNPVFCDVCGPNFKPVKVETEVNGMKECEVYCEECLQSDPELSSSVCGDETGLDWCIVGGESGPGARPMQLEWARAIVRQCKAASVPVFVKQLGACASDPVNGLAGAALAVPEEAAPLVSLRLKDKKGGDMTEWPDDLRVREFPVTTD